MSGVNISECQNIIDQVRAYLKNKVSDQEASLLEVFAQRYFSFSAVEDLKERSIADLYGAMLSHWKLIDQRMPGEAKIRIFNPNKEKDGWESTHTVIEISHDDIPFLVDSTRIVINRFGCQIHFIIHFGGFKVTRDDHHHIIEIVPSGSIEKNVSSEAPIYIEIDRLPDEKTMM